MALANEAGEPLVIEGRMTTPRGVPAPDVVYAYHTDAPGCIRTIRPRAYPTRGTPQHVHTHVPEPGKGICCIDDVIFDDDPLLTTAHRRTMRRGRGRDGLVFPAKDEQGYGRCGATSCWEKDPRL